VHNCVAQCTVALLFAMAAHAYASLNNPQNLKKNDLKVLVDKFSSAGGSNAEQHNLVTRQTYPSADLQLLPRGGFSSVMHTS
jgi:hypothetical protein